MRLPDHTLSRLQTAHNRGVRHSVPSFVLMGITCVWVLLFAACQPPPDERLLDRLSGIWETDEPRYANCYLEIRDDQIVFHNGLLHSDKNTIMDITGVTDKGVGRYDIHYKNMDGDKYLLSLILYTSKKGDIIRFKNQYQIYWTRKPLSTL